MKKSLLAALLAVVSSAWALADLVTITVTKPKAGDYLVLGSDACIQWTFTGLPSKFPVSVILFRNNAYVGYIAGKTTIASLNPCNWTWTNCGSYGAGTMAQPGGGYQIRVYTLVGYEHYGQSGTFSLGSMDFTSPAEGTSWPHGSPQVVWWTYSGFPEGMTVDLRLRCGDTVFVPNLVSHIPMGYGGKGGWKWAKAGIYAGGTVPPGNPYVIEIFHGNDKLASSKKFYLTSGTSFLKIDQTALQLHPVSLFNIPVSSPAEGAGYKQGAQMKISWDKTGISGYAKVKLELYTADKKTSLGTVDGMAGAQKANSGQFTTTLLKAIYKVGHSYVIRVSTPDGTHLGFSGAFHINAP
jgi:hypothetical protein